MEVARGHAWMDVLRPMLRGRALRALHLDFVSLNTELVHLLAEVRRRLRSLTAWVGERGHGVATLVLWSCVRAGIASSARPVRSAGSVLAFAWWLWSSLQMCPIESEQCNVACSLLGRLVSAAEKNGANMARRGGGPGLGRGCFGLSSAALRG
eukprot:350064-Chlamydomonas_euryale.AAC.4